MNLILEGPSSSSRIRLPTLSFTLSPSTSPRLTMLYVHLRSSGVRLLLCVLITAFPLLINPTARLAAQPAESLSTGIVPTMSINEVTEGTLLFRTNQPDRFTPAPILKTDVQIAITGIIARTTVRQEFTNPSEKKGDWLEGIYVFPLPETAA